MMNMELGWRAQQRWHAWLRGILIGLALVAFLLPLLWTLIASFGITPDNTKTPPTLRGQASIRNYTEEIGVAEPGFWQRVLTTITISAVSTLLTVTIGFLAAYSLARSRLRGKAVLIQSFLILASLPVMAYVIPLADTVRRLHLDDTFLGVTLAEAAVFTPLAVFVLYGYLSQVSTDVEEAARLDGAPLLEILGRIVLPLVMPGVIAIGIIVFVLNWNSLLIPLVLASVHVKTIPVALIDFFTFERELEWPTAAAALIISLMPVIVLITLAHGVLEEFVLEPLSSRS